MVQELTGRAWFQAIKEDYVKSYAYKICDVIRRLDPDRFAKEFGSIDNCVREVVDDASAWFDKWYENYVSGVIARVKSVPTTK